jgi:thermitase
MQISVLNLTAGARRVSDSELLKVIRAINRQIHEDVCSYWNLTGQLRLDPAGATAVDPMRAPPSLRGDAVLYLVDGSIASPDRLLGYHQHFNDQAPFGAVFVDVCAELREPWSVALSHEALELLVDPDVNLLCKGPHPDPAQSGRMVFHWLELCDAVQAEHYALDGVDVSNFVLPAYYSGAAPEQVVPCDFLMAGRSEAGALRPFGVKEGGYVGFFDPATGTDQQYFKPDDQAARERAAIKARLIKRVRRFDRRRLLYPLSPDGTGPAPAPSGATQPLARPTPAPGGVARGVFLRVRQAGDRGPASPAAAATAVAARVLGAGWTTTPFWHEPAADDRDFKISPPSDALTAAELWDHVYALQADPDVEVAEPILAQPLVRPGASADAGARASVFGSFDCTNGANLPGAANDCEWSLTQVKARAAWKELTDAGLGRGKNIVVGHPDTGYTNHPELKDREAPGGWNFLTNNASPIDPLEQGGLVPSPGHGTGTASVIASGEGPAGLHVTGVAPDATVMDLRVTDSVVIFDMSNVAKAIKYAADHGCHIISMSLGGVGWWYLHDAVKYAVQKGCIVLAAAGNCVWFVVWPAAYDETIAVAGTNVEAKPWDGSSRGRAVDISAPGDSVWHAIANQANEQRVDMGKGTSFAVATVAGAAALWLSKHGWDNLVAKYGAPNVAGLFKQALTASAWAPPGWDTANWGPGILDCARLLAADAPPAAFRGLERAAAPAESDGADHWIAAITHLVEHLGASATIVRSVLAASLGVAPEAVDARLREIGQELSVHLATDAGARDAFEAAVVAASSPAGGRAAAAAPARPAAVADALRHIGSQKLRQHIGP